MLPGDIITHIPGSFDKALSEGDLFFFPSTVYKHEESNVDVRIFTLLAQFTPMLQSPANGCRWVACICFYKTVHNLMSPPFYIPKLSQASAIHSVSRSRRIDLI